MEMGGDGRLKCPHEGSFKAIGAYDGHASKLYCRAHVDDYARQVPTTMIAEPRKVGDGPWPCEADWLLPGFVP